MPSSKFDSPVTIKLTASSGKEFACSALLERDPGFLKWNRIALIGNRTDFGVASCLHGDGNIRWELHNNPAWGAENQRTFGVAAVQSIGLTTGQAIDRDSIQKFGNLRIINYCEHISMSGDSSRIRFLFLQRPSDWYAYPIATRPVGFSQRGRWHQVAGTGLQLRLLTVSEAREDRRLSNEIELIQLPGVEMRPVENMDDDAFAARANDLWFSLRVLIAFRFRIYPSTLVTSIKTPGKFSEEWHPIKVEPREVEKDHIDPPFFDAVDEFFAQASAGLDRLKPQKETLHAAAFGYANSYNALVLESGLTSCVEAIERLVTAFEASTSIYREIVSRKEWRRIAESLKKVIDGLQLAPEVARRIKQGLTASVALTLEDRVLRMVAAQKKDWNDRDRQLLSGVNQMIKARNAIVHGRLVDDINVVYVELIRSRALFERLLLNFLNCAGFSSSSYPSQIIGQHERRLDISRKSGES